MESHAYIILQTLLFLFTYNNTNRHQTYNTHKTGFLDCDPILIF